MLRRYATTHKVDYIILGDNTTRIAQKILEETVKGRGFSLPLDLQLKDERFRNVAFVSPLRDVLNSHAAMYAHYSRSRVFFFPSFTTKAKTKIGISTLTSALLARLQMNFPSTAPTVLRTGLKIELSSSALRLAADDAEMLVVPPVVVGVVGTGEVEGGEVIEGKVKRQKWGGRRKKQDSQIIPRDLLLCRLCCGALPPLNEGDDDHLLCLSCFKMGNHEATMTLIPEATL